MLGGTASRHVHVVPGCCPLGVAGCLDISCASGASTLQTAHMSAGGTAAKKSPGTSCTRAAAAGRCRAHRAAAALVTQGLRRGGARAHGRGGAACIHVTSQTRPHSRTLSMAQACQNADAHTLTRPPVQQHTAHAWLARQQCRQEPASAAAHIAQAGAAVAGPIVILTWAVVRQ